MFFYGNTNKEKRVICLLKKLDRLFKKILEYITNLWYSISRKNKNREGDNMSKKNNALEHQANDILITNDMLRVPVDLIKIANNNGIEVYYQELPKDISGSIRYNEEKKKFQILVEKNEPEYRQRFTLAHELAHFFLEGQELLCNQEIHFDPKYRRDKNPAESRANYLAGALLMDKDMVTTLYDVCPSIPVLARTFNVSESAMTQRLIKLGLMKFE